MNSKSLANSAACPAPWTTYQRGKIQEESLYHEHRKHDGSLPLIGVNTLLPRDRGGDLVTEIGLIRNPCKAGLSPPYAR
jgi:hypothetical protein